MSKGNEPSKSPPAESLEDVVYRSSLAGDNKAMQGTNPLIAIPTTIVTYACVALLTFIVATKTEAGKRAVEKTLGVILDDDQNKIEDDDEPPPPPPPPPPIAALVKVEVKDTPPPPPISDQETIPDDAPKNIPTVDYSKAFATKDDGSSGGVIGGVIGSGSVVSSGSQQDVVANVSSSQVAELSRPPQPPYPAMAQRARVQGKVKLEITIGTDGLPKSVKVISGPPLLHNYATEWAMRWKFRPYTVDGHAQQARFILDLNFSIK
jgi:protein TonB